MEKSFSQSWVQNHFAFSKGEATSMGLPAVTQNFIEEGSMVITPMIATNILENHSFEGQRKTTNAHIDLLGSIAKSGQWMERDQITFCKLPDGTLYLVNGYHRMKMVIKFDMAIEFSIRVLLADDYAAVRRAYASFDTTTRKRSDGEIVSAMGILETYGLKKAIATAMFNATPILVNNFKIVNYQVAPEKVRDLISRVQLADRFWRYAQVWQNITNGGVQAIKKKLLNGQITAVAIATIKYCPEMAESFWRPIAMNEGLQRGDPRHAFVRKLLGTRYETTKAHGVVPMGCIHAALTWNAYNSGRKLEMLRDVAAFKLAGTPWK